MSASLGFGPIKDDDELLDRLGSRGSHSDDGLEGVFASWTTSIDEDERACARNVGPLGLRRVEGRSDEETVAAASQRVRVVRVPRSRAVAVLGALALTVSGGGVAAAINQTELAPVVRAIEKATAPIAALQVAAGTHSTTPTHSASSPAGVLPVLVDKARGLAKDGQYGKALGVIEAVRSMAPKDAAGQQITAQVDQLEKQITGGPVILADPPQKAPLTRTQPTTTLLSTTATGAPVTSPTATSSAPATSSPPATTSTPAEEKPTSTTPGDPTSTGAPTSTAPAETPATTAPTTTLGTAGGEQNPGTASPSKGTETTPTSGGTEAPRGSVSPSAPSESATNAPKTAQGSTAPKSAESTKKSKSSTKKTTKTTKVTKKAAAPKATTSAKVPSAAIDPAVSSATSTGAGASATSVD